tara:strand:+ start:213 stop:479 length:267 start_codon:yes stop_codon:yes gene_type:complete
MKTIKHKGWKLQVNSNELITVTKLGESREYDVEPIERVGHDDDDYVMLYHSDGSFTQVKFEEDDFLVIDKFDEDDEHVDTIGSHVFGE